MTKERIDTLRKRIEWVRGNEEQRIVALTADEGELFISLFSVNRPERLESIQVSGTLEFKDGMDDDKPYCAKCHEEYNDRKI